MQNDTYLLTKEWKESNFLIPIDKGLRIELKQKLEAHVHSGSMFLPDNAKIRTLLLARLAAVEAYDAAVSNLKDDEDE